MERGKVLMEFEFPAEADKASKIGSISFGGFFLRLEKWKPETGCLREGERSREAWVRVVGLPVSLWERDILRRIGDACGGFLAVDHQTEKMEELQWARILVKRNDVILPNEVEVWVEGSCYRVTLWWEIRPVLKTPTCEKKGKAVVTGAEVGDDVSARARERVTETMEGSRLEVCLLNADGTRSQFHELGQTSNPSRSEDGPSDGPHALSGLGLLGQVKPSSNATGPANSGIEKPTEKAWPLRLLQEAGLDFQSPFFSRSSSAQAEKGLSAAECSRSPLKGSDAAISTFWVKDDQWGTYGDEPQWGGISRTDSALLEEDARYVNALSSSGLVALDTPSPFFSPFGRTPLMESFDRSRELADSATGDNLCKGTGYSEKIEEKCWDLVEISNDCMEVNRKALCLARLSSQVESGWEEERWEESDLARFSQFLGFSTEGLEKDILEFMVKIRKRRERIHNKVMLEKSKFEKELRRLECSVNYEGGKKKKCSGQGRGCQIMEVQ
ncbi:hypothetical protein CK203_016707 [Vitis vinifera]|uniref:Uncharacterized protein n=1 Tax=Vitis vinifera TaxID=29760 RepID=A0A438J255_VITVI|nr:hypothetical protein CK203_016707 [Vitis vinifera]